MERRAVLKIVALTALSQKLNALPGAAMSHMQAAPAAPTATPYTLQFFSEEESRLLDQLMEMIIPADDHSPGAHEAQTNLFADLMVATSDNAVKKQWQDGIRLIREEAKGSSLDRGAAPSRGQRRESHNRSGTVLRIAETDDCQRLLYFCDGHTQGDGIRRQHLPRCFSRMYSSRTSGLRTAGSCPWFPHKGRVPHISLVFREMWDTTDVDR